MRLSPELTVLLGAGAGSTATAVATGGWRRVKAQNRSDDSTSARVDIQSAIDLVEAYRVAVEDFRAQLTALRIEYAEERKLWRGGKTPLRGRGAVLVLREKG